MSGGRACACEERQKPIQERRWRILQWRCNHSAFNGYHMTPSEWSSICCLACQAHWRTKADYVDSLSHITQSERLV